MRTRWLLLFLACGALFAALVFVRFISGNDVPEGEDLPDALTYDDIRQDRQDASPAAEDAEEPGSESIASEEESVPEPASDAEELPLEMNLAVPFTPQAPHANWDLPYQEACEEASVLMVARYKKGEPIRSSEDADGEIKQLVAFEEDLLGFYKDTTAEETVRFADEYYGFTNSRTVYDFSLEDMKRELVRGNPVILPAAGQVLPNPYFRDPGPLYHMLVVRGYTKDGRIITNDPGTRRGEEFLYDPEALMNAVHDWNGGDVLNGRKVMIVLE